MSETHFARGGVHRDPLISRLSREFEGQRIGGLELEDFLSALEVVRYDIDRLLNAANAANVEERSDHSLRVNDFLFSLTGIKEAMLTGNLDLEMTTMIDLVRFKRMWAGSLFDQIHQRGTRPFAQLGNKPNEFTSQFIDVARDRLEGGQVMILGGGSNAGDPIALAGVAKKVIVVDSSPKAIESMNQSLATHYKGDRERIEVIEGDYLEILLEHVGLLDAVFSYSSLHYFPPNILKKVIFRMIQFALLPRNGVFGLGMKTPSSASAGSDYQIPIVDFNGDEWSFQFSFDRMYRILRLFLSKGYLVHLIDPSFDLSDDKHFLGRQSVSGYERQGEREEFIHLIAYPKAII